MEQGLRSVFISYSRQSEDYVQQIVDDLRRCGVDDVWWDNHLTGGQDWWERILDQIRRADVLVCLVDVGASESLAVRREYKYANDLRKAVVPVLLTSDVNVSQLAVELAGKQYVDYRPQNQHPYEDLSKALRELPPTPSLPSPLPLEPEMPQSAGDYLVGRIIEYSLEPLCGAAFRAAQPLTPARSQIRRLVRPISLYISGGRFYLAGT